MNLNIFPNLNSFITTNQTGQFASVVFATGELKVVSGVLSNANSIVGIANSLQRARIFSGPYNNTRSTVAGVGTSSSAIIDGMTINATGAGGYARRDFYGASIGYIGNGSEGAGTNSTYFGRPCFTWVTLNGFGNGASTQTDSYRAFYFGKTTLSAGPLSTAGWGFLHEGTGNSFRVVSHNGSTLTSGNLFTINNFSPTYKNISLVMYSNGSGIVSAWVTSNINNSSTPFDLINSSPTSVITGGPTGIGGDIYPAVEVYAGALGGGQNRLDSAVFGVIWG